LTGKADLKSLLQILLYDRYIRSYKSDLP
jgi:hypothetical protein